MRKNISLYDIYLSIENTRINAENTAVSVMDYYKIKTAVALRTEYNIPIEQAVKMLYLMRYQAELQVDMPLYEYKGTYYMKKPSLWRNIFKKYNHITLKISHDDIYLGDKNISFDDAKNIYVNY